MGKSKLKSALGAHQAAAARTAAAKARDAREAAKAKEKHRSVGEKRALKRQRQAAASAAEATGGTASGAAARATRPIAHDDTVLLLGEGNFSFSAALLALGHPGHLLCATAYDSEDECVDKYPDAAENIAVLRAAGARVLFSVDGGAVDKRKEARGPWSRVVFNFPHVGKGITDQDRNIRANQEMLLRTMRAVAPLLTSGPSAFPIIVNKKGKGKKKMPKPGKPKRAPTPDSDAEAEELDDDEFATAAPIPASFTPPQREGSLLITLLDQSPYTLWDLKALATRPPPHCPGTKLAQPRYRLLRSFEFVPDVYPGYAHRRTIGWREGKSAAHNEEIVGRIGKARSWEFAVREEED